MTTLNTDLVANFEASPQVLNNAAELHGVLRVAQGTVELAAGRSEEHTSELQSQSTISYAVFCLKKKKIKNKRNIPSSSIGI